MVASYKKMAQSGLKISLKSLRFWYKNQLDDKGAITNKTKVTTAAQFIEDVLFVRQLVCNALVLYLSS